MDGLMDGLMDDSSGAGSGAGHHQPASPPILLLRVSSWDE
jgi:hypothetical protein